MKYYKVVEFLNEEVIIDTAQTNYNSTLGNKNKFKNLLDLITQFSSVQRLPLDFYFSLNNSLALFGSAFLNNLPSSKNGLFELSDITGQENHKKLIIKESELIYFIESLRKIGISLFTEGFYLWEYIFEEVRNMQNKDLPSRGESFFLFDSIENCEYYRMNFKGGGVICEVEFIETGSLFMGDMALLNAIPNNVTYFQAVDYGEKYWLGEMSQNPVVEYLFQGKCILKQLNI